MSLRGIGRVPPPIWPGWPGESGGGIAGLRTAELMDGQMPGLQLFLLRREGGDRVPHGGILLFRGNLHGGVCRRGAGFGGGLPSGKRIRGVLCRAGRGGPYDRTARPGPGNGPVGLSLSAPIPLPSPAITWIWRPRLYSAAATDYEIMWKDRTVEALVRELVEKPDEPVCPAT